jgi:signal peptidase I
MEPNTANNKDNKASFLTSLFEWIKVIVIALIISIPIRVFIAEPFIVDGASMDPSFATGQFLIVDRLTYRFENPKRGDVIVFRYPNNPSTYYIKRIIGLPEEVVNINGGVISIIKQTKNGILASSTITIKEPYIKDSHRSYEDFNAVLKPDEYFVMGDNRSESSDSRIWGPLEKRLIIGRPALRLLPITKLSVYPGEYTEK